MSDPIDRQLPPAIDEARIAATWNRIAARRWPAARSPWRKLLLTACVVAVGVAAAILAWPRSTRPAPLTSRDPSISVVPGAVWTDPERAVILDDESAIALAADSRLEILANDGTRFATLLAAGTARFDVHPDGPRRWEIETALATVEVVGTAFTVTLRDGALEVGVERGVVLVHGELVPGRVVRLTPGKRLVVGPRVATAAVVVAPIEAPVVMPIPVAPKARAQRPAPIARPPEPQVVAPPSPLEAVSDVVAKADRLIGAGDPAGAAALLERVHRVDGDQASGLVAFTLGRLYLDALGKPDLAAAAFDEVIAHGSPRSLLDDAYARRVDALVRGGHRDRASAALDDYARAYPHGRRLAALRGLLP